MEKRDTSEIFASDSDVADEFEELADAETIMELAGKCDTWGIMASFSPFVTDRDNMVRWVRLKKEVRGLNLDFEQFTSGYRYPQDGKVTKIQQKLLFIPNIGLYPLLLLGYRHQQATVIHGSRMGAIAYNVETTEPEITVTKSEMLTAWTSLLTLPGTYIMHDNPNDVSIHRSNETVKRFRTFEKKDQPVDFIPPKFNEGDVKKIWDVIDSGEFFGIVSAYQPGSSVLTLAEEHERLRRDVHNMKYAPIDQNYEYNFADGNGMTLVTKKSLFIPGISYEELIELGRKWNQETVAFGRNGAITMVRVSDENALLGIEINSMKLAFNFLLTNQHNIPW